MEFTFRWYRRSVVFHAVLVLTIVGMHSPAKGMVTDYLFQVQDTIAADTLIADTLAPVDKQPEKKNTISFLSQKINRADTLHVVDLKKSAYISVQQYLKGNVAGVYVQENNGEPGTIQSMLVRGLSSPVFSNRDIAAVQPAVYVNGMPLIGRHPFVYDTKQYDYNPIGSANNLLSGVDMNNVLSIEVIKDPARLAQLGPFAVNGAIWIQTHDAVNSRKNTEKVTLQASYGVAAPPQTVRPTSATYEYAFRKQFYDAYGLPFGVNQLPAYLQDPTDVHYFGNANWPESYYNMGHQYNAHASLRGGGENASLLFTASSLKNAGIADGTNYQRHNLNFFLTMQPLKNIWMDAMIAGTTTSRKRNQNQRDRYAETEYLTDFSFPMAPAGQAYSHFLSLYKETDDRNALNYINGYLKLRYDRNQWKTGVELLYDHNADVRHVFWPSTLMESVSYVSDFSGVNRRVVLRGYAGYTFDFNASDHLLNVQVETNYNRDLNKYNYTKAFDGSNDKYKTTLSGGYKTYNFIDREEGALLSSGFHMGYQYKDHFSLLAVLKYDGYSKMQPDRRWLFTPALSASWNLRNQLELDNDLWSDLSLKASWARIGRLVGSDRFALGPNYTSNNIGWLHQWSISSQNSFATFSRPYASGWASYGIDWPYSDKWNVALSAAFFQKRLDIQAEFYNSDDQNMLMAMPVPQEYGYRFQYLSGMHVNNRGVDLSLQGVWLQDAKRLRWTTALHLNYNQNTLKALPNGREELIAGDRKLKVGHSIDQFWLYENQGTYQGGGLSMAGIDFQQGDAKWNDVNQDSRINEDDKVLKGHALPQWTGGMTNYLNYGSFDLNFQLFFALGHSALNTFDAQRYNFLSIDEQRPVANMKEIFFWQNTDQKNDYPIYKPTSDIESYRQDQDLFLEKASYLKLRSVSLGYDLNNAAIGNKKLKGLYVYLTANNLWTLSNFSGIDPELIDFNGYYTGYAQRIPFTMNMGFRYKF